MPITEAHRQQLRDLKVETLAKKFADVLLEWLEPEQFEQMKRDNAERNDNTCASHDYCDANMAMDEAFSQATSPTFSVCDFMEEYQEVYAAKGIEAANASEAGAIFTKWNRAWEVALNLYLTTKPVECLGHPAGPNDPMGVTVYCDGSCRSKEVARG